MMKASKKLVKFALCASVAFFAIAQTANAESNFSVEELARSGGKSKTSTNTTTPSYTLQSWMHQDVAGAWSQGLYGSGTQMTFVDDFSSASRYTGNLGLGTTAKTHGEWTSLEGSMVAPQASIVRHDFTDGSAVSLARRKFNVFNLSYGMFAADGYTAVRWGTREYSITQAAKNGKAVIAKAAGNDYGTAVGEANAQGLKDYLNFDLIGAQSAIFVGALSANGSIEAPSSMAAYSNIAGSNPLVQSHFLVVGVEGDKTGLRGTSFAAPIVAGYSAIVHSKFKSATPTEVTNRLLDTARTDTLNNYTAEVYGKGEASLARALAPNSIQ